MAQICVSKLTGIGSDNGLSLGRRQAILWTNAGIFLIGPIGTNFSEILIANQTFLFKEIYLKMSSGKCRFFVSTSMCWDAYKIHDYDGVWAKRHNQHNNPIHLIILYALISVRYFLSVIFYFI